jgi:homoserine dehydrogenase
MNFGAEITFKDIPTEGIRGLIPLDFELAAEFGYRIKLLGIARRAAAGLADARRLRLAAARQAARVPAGARGR